MAYLTRRSRHEKHELAKIIPFEPQRPGTKSGGDATDSIVLQDKERMLPEARRALERGDLNAARIVGAHGFSYSKLRELEPLVIRNLDHLLFESKDPDFEDDNLKLELASGLVENYPITAEHAERYVPKIIEHSFKLLEENLRCSLPENLEVIISAVKGFLIQEDDEFRKRHLESIRYLAEVTIANELAEFQPQHAVLLANFHEAMELPPGTLENQWKRYIKGLVGVGWISQAGEAASIILDDDYITYFKHDVSIWAGKRIFGGSTYEELGEEKRGEFERLVLNYKLTQEEREELLKVSSGPLSTILRPASPEGKAEGGSSLPASPT